MTPIPRRCLLATVGVFWFACWPAFAQLDAGRVTDGGDCVRSFSGIYPPRAHFHSQGECGTGTVAVA